MNVQAMNVDAAVAALDASDAADAAAAAANVAAVEAIDLTTYNGEDPCLIHEAACQNCNAKQSETQLTRCSGCSFVWYCSDECIEANSEWHGFHCDIISRRKATIETQEQELREQHGIEDPYVPKMIIPLEARQSHERLQRSVALLEYTCSFVSDKGKTKELWEMTLDFHQKNYKMSEPRSRTSLYEAAKIPFILIRLDRLEDAWRFIRNTMVTYRSNGSSPVVIEYEPEDRYTDCLEWVRSSYPLSTDDTGLRTHFHNLMLGLVVIKLRIRVAAARNAWKDTINQVFLKTKKGKELDEVKSVLEEYFSLSDDKFQLEQIRQLIGIVHHYDTIKLPCMPLISGLLRHSRENRSTCLHRTPNGPQLLTTIVQSEGFEDWVKNNEPLVAAQNKERAKKKRQVELIFVSFFALGLAFNRGFIYWFGCSFRDGTIPSVFPIVPLSWALVNHLGFALMYTNEKFEEKVKRHSTLAKLFCKVCAIAFFVIIHLIEEEFLARKWDLVLLMVVIIDLVMWGFVVRNDALISKNYLRTVEEWLDSFDNE